jgi:GT2 family glycosyltransferase
MADGNLVCTIVLNWERPEDTLRCIDSVLRSTYHPLQIVVVDNGSLDDSADRISRAHPEIDLLRNPENLGYAGGNNTGLRYALQTEAAYLLLLNNDVVVAPKAVARLVTEADADPRIGVLGGKVYWAEDPQRLWAAGPAFPPGEKPLDKGQFDHKSEVNYVSGCFLMARREAVEQAGLLDEDYFLVCEEVDWCLRIGAAGYQIVYLPLAEAWHRGSASFGGTESAAYRYYLTRNWPLLLRKRGFLTDRPRSLLRAAAQTWLRQARSVLGSGGPTTLHRLRAVTRGTWDFLRGRVGQGPDWLTEEDSNRTGAKR